MNKRLLLGLASAALVSGCSTLPKFGGVLHPDEVVGPTVQDVVKHIQCEITNVLVKDKEDKVLRDLHTYRFMTSAVLTLEVTGSQAFNPSVNQVEPYLRAGTSRIIALGGTYSGTQRRTITVSFLLDLDPAKAELAAAKGGACFEYNAEGNGITGTLGLREILLSGIMSTRGYFFPTTPEYDSNGKPIDAKSRPKPSFGSTVEFAIARTIGGGPNFTLTYFRAPAVSGNLLTAGKSNKDTLIIAFAAGVDRNKNLSGSTIESAKTPGVPTGMEQAAREAQDQVQRMILLQRLAQ